MCASAAWRGESYHTHSAQRITLRISGRVDMNQNRQHSHVKPVYRAPLNAVVRPLEITKLLLFFASSNVEMFAI